MLGCGVKQNISTEPTIQALQVFCENAGIAPITAWRFRKRGWLVTINIAGRQYVTSEGIAEFKRRAAAGEFSRQHVVPTRGSSLPQ
jgi:hypothetical protein